MGMITFSEKGSFKNTERYLQRLKANQRNAILNKYGSIGVQALASATPVDSGLTAASWFYRIESRSGQDTIYWCNSNVVHGLSIALLIQYGHGTGTGGYVQGRDYINPAIRPIFDRMAAEVWEEVTKI